MNPKSNILVQIEILECVRKLKEYTEYLFETFSIDDIVLGVVGGKAQELTTGYMSESTEFDTLDKALDGFDPCKNCLRVKEGKYYRGTWTASPIVSESSANLVLSISDFREF